MDDFYQKLEELDVAAALSYARQATRTWNIAQMEERYQILGGEQAGWERERERLTLMWRGRLPEHPLDHPYFWAGFSLHSGIDDSVQNLINPSRPAAE
jgi:CHAT domain-containing protein